MDHCTKEYSTLFNAITDAIDQLDRIRSQLVAAQQKAEDMFIAGEGESQQLTLE